METKDMPSAMDALLDLRDWIAHELKYLEKTQSVNEEKKAFLVTLYNMIPDEVAEGIVKPEGEEEWHENWY